MTLGFSNSALSSCPGGVIEAGNMDCYEGVRIYGVFE